jgi:gamma-glutamylcyclotransferase (GGCT)/AIG2-like uncharacterized protein YtfP
MRFFFYGTLRDHDVRRAVIGPGVDRISIVPATLSGWRCVLMRGRHYPVLRPDSQAVTEGVIADGIDIAQARRLDRFETREYRARLAPVRNAAGGALEAKIYFAIRPGLASATPWRFEEWKRRHKGAFIRSWTKIR